jgi:hypothetical protein
MRLSPKIIPRTTRDMPSIARFEGFLYCFPLPISKNTTIRTRATTEMAIHTGSMNTSFWEYWLLSKIIALRAKGSKIIASEKHRGVR